MWLTGQFPIQRAPKRCFGAQYRFVKPDWSTNILQAKIQIFLEKTRIHKIGNASSSTCHTFWKRHVWSWSQSQRWWHESGKCTANGLVGWLDFHARYFPMPTGECWWILSIWKGSNKGIWGWLSSQNMQEETLSNQLLAARHPEFIRETRCSSPRHDSHHSTRSHSFRWKGRATF